MNFKMHNKEKICLAFIIVGLSAFSLAYLFYIYLYKDLSRPVVMKDFFAVNSESKLQSFISKNCSEYDKPLSKISGIFPSNLECKASGFLRDQTSIPGYSFVISDKESNEDNKVIQGFYWNPYKTELFKNDSESITIILNKNDWTENDPVGGILYPKIRYIKIYPDYQLTIDYENLELNDLLNEIMRKGKFHYPSLDSYINNYDGAIGVGGAYWGKPDDYLDALDTEKTAAYIKALKADEKFQAFIKTKLENFRSQSNQVNF